MSSNNKKMMYSFSDILNKYKSGSKIIDIVFLLVIISGIFIDALTPPVKLTWAAMKPKIIFIVIFALICSIIRICVKFTRILFLRKILIDECAPNKYVEVLKGILEVEHKNVYKLRCIFDMISSLIYLGKFNEALDLLRSKEINKDKLKKDYLLSYYIYLSECYYELGNINELKKNKSMAENLIKNQRYNLAQRKSNDRAICDLNGNIAFYNNDLKKARQLYQEELINSTSVLSRVVTLYNLALIDVKEGKMECAKEKFEIVIQYGNELYQVNKAKENLMAINDMA